jgi:hypothetical protein
VSGTSAILGDGEPNAEYFGWPRPYLEVTEAGGRMTGHRIETPPIARSPHGTE